MYSGSKGRQILRGKRVIVTVSLDNGSPHEVVPELFATKVTDCFSYSHCCLVIAKGRG